jgi:predicted Fe-Mo cluster-binding NifX family protein
MRIAVSADTNNELESQVAHHFGRCPFFAIVEVEGTEFKSVEVINNPFYARHQPGQVPGFIQSQNANVMLSGGMGRRAIQFFEGYGIHAATGAYGTVRQAVESYLGGELRGAEPCKESEEHHKHGHHHH